MNNADANLPCFIKRKAIENVFLEGFTYCFICLSFYNNVNYGLKDQNLLIHNSR